MMGIDENDWIDEEELLLKLTGKPRRAAILPFAQDERFASKSKYREQPEQGWKK